MAQWDENKHHNTATMEIMLQFAITYGTMSYHNMKQ